MGNQRDTFLIFPTLHPAQIYSDKINKSPTICLLTLMPHSVDMPHRNLTRHKIPIFFISQQCGICYKEIKVYLISGIACETSSSQITKEILDHHLILQLWHLYLLLYTHFISSFFFFFLNH